MKKKYPVKYPADLIIRPLAPREWKLVAENYRRETENAMPATPLQSIFYGVFIGEKLIGYAHIEHLLHLNAVYLEKEYRQTNIVRGIFDTIEAQIPGGFPLVILPDKNVRRLLESYNFRRLDAPAIWRRDF